MKDYYIEPSKLRGCGISKWPGVLVFYVFYEFFMFF